MKLTQLKTLVKRGESDTLELKSSTANLPAGMQTVCAFLNSDYGGTVIFGVKDDGKIVGQKISDKTRKDLAAEINKIDPTAKIDIDFVKVVDDLQAIVLLINPSPRAPYTYGGRAFIRNQSTTMIMSKEEYLYLYNKNNQTVWEGLTNNSCTIKDLDKIRIKEFIRMSISAKRLPSGIIKEMIPTVLTKMNLLVDEKCTNAAVILFCKKEEKQFMQSTLQLARFRGIDKKAFLDIKSLTGNAFDLYDKAMDFLHFNLPVAAVIEPGKSQRVETPAIPYTVLREAVTNALIHRDYSNAGGSVAIAIYSDRVTITNAGSLPKGVELKQLLKEHRSVPRNPLIAHAFYLCGQIEKWGRGTIDMIEDCKNVGNPIPIYEEAGGGFSITLPFKSLIHRTAFQTEDTVV